MTPNKPAAGYIPCRNCGSQLDATAIRCPRCGTPRRTSIVAWLAPLAAGAIVASVLLRSESGSRAGPDEPAAPAAVAGGFFGPAPATTPDRPPAVAAEERADPAPPRAAAEPLLAPPDLTTPPTDLAERGCVIKATHAEDGSQVYRLPETVGYAETPVDPAAGDRWYCEELEAIEAGFGLP